MYKIFFTLCLAALILIPKLAAAQEIEARVQVNTEQIIPEDRINIQTMESDITTYLNTNRFTDKDWEGDRIPVDVNVVLKGGGGKYSARLFISSKRILDGTDAGSSVALRLVDDKWAFNYALGANLTFNPTRFDEFSSLLDFYILLIIGYDMDTYGELDGTKMYEAAKQVCNIGNTYNADGYSTRSMPGEFTRYNLVSELTDLRYEEFRKMIFSYFVDGLDEMARNKDKGMAAVVAVIKDMSVYKQKKLVGPSVLLQAFFDAKSRELSELFKGYEDESIYKYLEYLDPSNTLLYEEAKNKK